MDRDTCLLPCLRAQTWRLLRAISRAHGLSFDSNLSVVQAAERLHAHLLRADTLSVQWAVRSAEARSASIALLEASGCLRRDEFVHRFGEVRPYRPWQPGAPRAPWRDPQSPAEEVVFYGLAFLVNLGSAARPAWAAVLPDEFHDPVSRLAALFPSAPGSAPLSLSPLSLISPLSSDMFALLSFLDRRQIRPIWDRWLPPTALRELSRHLSRADDLETMRSARSARSERNVPHVAFLHYLAERAGLVGIAGGYLEPTVLAREWLDAPLPERLQRLWQAWTAGGDEPDDLWMTYRLPGWDVEGMPRRFLRLLAHLARRAPGSAQSTADFLDALIAADPPLFRVEAYAHWAGLDADSRAEFQNQVRRALTGLLDGPLAWFGVLLVQKAGSGDPPALTSLGAALLGRDDGQWPVDPEPAPSIVSGRLTELDGKDEAAILLTAPRSLPWPRRLALEELVPPDPAQPGAYPLTRARLLLALQRGRTVEGVIDTLESTAQEPLPPAPLGAIYRWAEEHERFTVRQVVLLEAKDAADLRDLTRPRRIRETLGETLSPRAVRVYADELPALLRRLAARGHYPRLDLPVDSPLSRLAGSLSRACRGKGPGVRAKSTETTIAVALQIYAELADELGLSTVGGGPPHALARAWTEALSLPQRDAVERVVEQSLDRLRRAAIPEGDYRLPAPTGPLLSRLEQAIAQETTVEIDYYTAGRDHETTRQVDPLRLEWRGEVAYLVAHCHLRGEQRVFRVDRISAIRDVKRKT